MSQRYNPTPSPRRVQPGPRPAPRASTRPAGGAAPSYERRPVNPQSTAARRSAAGRDPYLRAQSPRPAARSANARPNPNTRPNSTVRPNPNARPAAPVRKNGNSGKKAAAYLKKAGKIALEILRLIGMILLFAVSCGLTGIKKGNNKLNVFRKNETTTVITNCAIATAFVSVLILIFLLVKPSMDASRAEKLAAKGDAAEAVRLVEKLERKGYDAQKLIKTQKIVAEELIEREKFDEARGSLASMEKNENTKALSDRFD
ncbi:MAG: hypothetical protein IIX93_12905, partial [Clostridia bacterium]|nr:hypothetical protein [Clostridia bacterium]